jgi:hypothetical protein
MQEVFLKRWATFASKAKALAFGSFLNVQLNDCFARARIDNTNTIEITAIALKTLRMKKTF